jgi:hypothetical protein
LAFPSSSNADPHATGDIKIDSNGWKTSWSEQAQADWIDTYLPLLIAKQAVTGIFWTHLTDQSPHEFPNAGLLDQTGRPKKVFESLRQHSQDHLQY